VPPGRLVGWLQPRLSWPEASPRGPLSAIGQRREDPEPPAADTWTPRLALDQSHLDSGPEAIAFHAGDATDARKGFRRRSCHRGGQGPARRELEVGGPDPERSAPDQLLTIVGRREPGVDQLDATAFADHLDVESQGHADRHGPQQIESESDALHGDRCRSPIDGRGEQGRWGSAVAGTRVPGTPSRGRGHVPVAVDLEDRLLERCRHGHPVSALSSRGPPDGSWEGSMDGSAARAGLGPWSAPGHSGGGAEAARLTHSANPDSAVRATRR
jgi:hypothetical protein